MAQCLPVEVMHLRLKRRDSVHVICTDVNCIEITDKGYLFWRTSLALPPILVQILKPDVKKKLICEVLLYSLERPEGGGISQALQNLTRQKQNKHLFKRCCYQPFDLHISLSRCAMWWKVCVWIWGGWKMHLIFHCYSLFC